MRVKLGWIPRLFSILFIIVMFVCLNVLWTTSSLSHLTNKSTFNSSQFRLSVDSVFITNATGRADAIKTVLETNDDLKFLETGYLSKNISTDTSGTTPARPQYFITTLQLGQLGNNMFQYAGLLGLAKMNGRTPFFPISSLVRQVFKISHVDNIKEASTWKRLPEASHGKYESVYEHLPEGNLTLAAYLQSYKYFQSIDKDIRQEFQFREGIQRRAMGLIKYLRPKIGTRTPIGVHVRRFDLLTQKEIRLGSLTAPKSYFQQAFAWMKSRHGDVVFLVASDDPEWCKENILQDDDVILMPHATADVHLCALAACRHVIMSVGTFGWWAGWLGGGDVIYYTKPYAPGSPKDKGFSREDFFPLHWIGLGDSPESVTEPPQPLIVQEQLQSSGSQTVATAGRINSIGEGAGIVGSNENVGSINAPIGGSLPNHQNIPSSLGGSTLLNLPPLGLPGVAAGSSDQVSLNKLLSSQEKTLGVASGQGSSMVIDPNQQQRVIPAQELVNMKQPPKDLPLQQMWKNQALLKATGLGETMKPSGFSDTVNVNAEAANLKTLNPHQNLQDQNVLAANLAQAGISTNIKPQNSQGSLNTKTVNQIVLNPSERVETFKTNGDALVQQNSVDTKVFNNAAPIAGSGINSADSLPSIMRENIVEKFPNSNLEVVNSIDTTNMVKDSKIIPDNLSNRNIEVKSYPNVESEQSINLTPEVLKTLLSQAKFGDSIKPVMNGVESGNIEGLSAGIKSGTIPLKTNDGSQVTGGQEQGVNGVIISENLGIKEHSLAGQSLENKEID